MTCALVLGRAENVLAEAKKAHELAKIDFVLATGPIAVDYSGDIDCWVWFHTELFPDFAERRARKGYAPVKSYWSVKYQGRGRASTVPGIDVKYINWDKGGSSGLVAVVVALQELKVDRVVLAGVPMTADGGRYDDHKVWKEAAYHRKGWTNNSGMLLGRVRSFSGWTKEFLEGKDPTAEWMREEERAAA